MKRLTIGLIGFSLLLGLTSCGGDSKPTVDDGSTNVVAPDNDAFTVKFITGTDDAIPSQSVKKGEKAKKPADPAKDGYTFDGWYIGDEKWVFSGYTVTEDITLEAKFIKNVYNIKIDRNNGSQIETLEIAHGEVLELEEPIKEDYVFIKWVDSKGNTIDSNYVVLEDTTITAIWDNEFTISFDSNGGDMVEAMTVKYNSTIDTLPSAHIPGAEFMGWFLDDAKIEAPFKYTYKNDITLVAKWMYVDGYYQYEILKDSSASIIKYTGNEENIVIPDTLGGLRVTNVRENAFTGNNIISIKLGKYITSLENNAFSYCFYLQEITFNDVITSYGENIIRGSFLKRITIRNNVNLKSICTNDFFDISISIIYNENDTLPLGEMLFKDYGADKVNSVELIGAWPEIVDKQFENFVNAKSIAIPDGVKRIGASAFLNCSSITEATIPASVEAIGEHAFEGCSKLNNIIIEAALTEIPGYAFYNCYRLGKIALPSSVKRISESAFEGCDFESVTIPNGVEAIGASAFSISNLGYVVLPESLKEISDRAFLFCPLMNVFYKGSEQQFNQIKVDDVNRLLRDARVFYNSNITNLEKRVQEDTTYLVANTNELFIVKCEAYHGTILDFNDIDSKYKLVSIADYAFEYCPNLEKVVISKDISYIGEFAFGKDNIIGRIIVDKDNSYYDSRNESNAIIETKTNTLVIGCKNTLIPDDIECIGARAFSNIKALTSINIPASVRIISDSAFELCENLDTIELHEGLEKILRGAFNSCIKLKAVKLPNTLSYIGESVFQYCNNLTDITIPEGITAIYRYTFNHCTSLINLVLPSTLEGIEYKAIMNCTSLTSIIIPRSVKDIGINFQGCSSLTINCEAEAQPLEWNDLWNYDNRPVSWGYKEN